MPAQYDLGLLGTRRGKSTIRRSIRICIKCGSSRVQREKDDIVCQDCGAVTFFCLS